MTPKTIFVIAVAGSFTLGWHLGRVREFEVFQAGAAHGSKLASKVVLGEIKCPTNAAEVWHLNRTEFLKFKDTTP